MRRWALFSFTKDQAAVNRTRRGVGECQVAESMATPDTRSSLISHLAVTAAKCFHQASTAYERVLRHAHRCDSISLDGLNADFGARGCFSLMAFLAARSSAFLAACSSFFSWDQRFFFGFCSPFFLAAA